MRWREDELMEVYDAWFPLFKFLNRLNGLVSHKSSLRLNSIHDQFKRLIYLWLRDDVVYTGTSKYALSVKLFLHSFSVSSFFTQQLSICLGFVDLYLFCWEIVNVTHRLMACQFSVQARARKTNGAVT